MRALVALCLCLVAFVSASELEVPGASLATSRLSVTNFAVESVADSDVTGDEEADTEESDDMDGGADEDAAFLQEAVTIDDSDSDEAESEDEMDIDAVDSDEMISANTVDDEDALVEADEATADTMANDEDVEEAEEIHSGGAQEAVALLEADSEDETDETDSDETASSTEADNAAAIIAFAAEHNIDLEHLSASDMRLMQQKGFWDSAKKMASKAAGAAKGLASKAGGAASSLFKKVKAAGIGAKLKDLAGKGLKGAGALAKVIGKGVLKAAGKGGALGLAAAGALAALGGGSGGDDEDESAALGDGTVASDQVIRSRHKRQKEARRRHERDEYRRREKDRRERRRRGGKRELFNGVGRRFWGKDADVPEVWREPEDVEDCVACQYVWKQVEQDVGASAITQTIYDSFQHNALDAQRSLVFYPACQTMFEAIDDMTNDYMLGYTVNQICENSMLCRPRNLEAFINYQRKKGPRV